MEAYRVIPIQTRDGITNTAIDDALEYSLKGRPIIVFSKWTPTVSIGIGQDLYKDVDVNCAERLGAKIVRRKSGGRTVYLDENYIGFTIIDPTHGVSEFNFPERYKEWCGKVCEALKYLGIDANLKGNNDILVNGRKIGNAAMVARKDYLLIHGSLRYRYDNLDEMLNILKIDGVQLKDYKEEASKVITSVDMESEIGEEELYNSLVEKMCPNASVEAFTEDELETIEELKKSYDDKKWVKRGMWMSGKRTKKLKSRGPCDFIFDKTLMIPSLEGKVKFY